MGVVLAISHARYQSSDDQLSRSISRGLNSSTDHHNDGAPKDGLLPAHSVAEHGGDDTASEASDVVQGHDGAQEARRRIADGLEKAGFCDETAKDTLGDPTVSTETCWEHYTGTDAPDHSRIEDNSCLRTQ